MDEQTIFTEALAIEDVEARATFLDGACEKDDALRQRVDDLLDIHGRRVDFMREPAVFPSTFASTSTMSIGTQIGPYKLRELLGEGGMGEVYVAEQTEPVRRKVALKTIKPGMATKDVVARFEAERQALAMMDHPNIAKVFDGGSTKPPLSPSGRGVGGEGAGQPFFVMELVLGVPITDYCDVHQLTTRQRLELFLKICQAVHHAHQKGVIHRDIKPGNVLVAEIDGAAVPKVIDFGVAKAIDQKLTKDTVYTNVAQMIGTPLYMSPEQATLGVADVDTRSDVYSLGVLLYELLTGQTPFDRDTLKQAAFEEMQRIIREDEPPRPSARVSTLKAESLSTVSAKRRSDPRRLGESFRGELDWIVMKCLEKDRNRRYESARELAADIQRYLFDETVQARPQSRAYRVRKIVRRHRVPVAAAATLAVVLTTATVLSSLALSRAVAERELARENLTRSLDLIENVISPAHVDLWLPADSLQRKTRDMLLQQAISFYESLDEASQSEPRVRFGLAQSYCSLYWYRQLAGDVADALARRAIQLLHQLLDEDRSNVDYRLCLADLHVMRGRSHRIHGQRRRAASESAKGTAIMRRLIGEHPLHATAHREFIRISGIHGEHLRECGRLSEARDVYLRALDVVQRFGDSDHEDFKPLSFYELAIRTRFATLLIEMGEYQRALEHFEAARGIAQPLHAKEKVGGPHLFGYWLSIIETCLARTRNILQQSEMALDHVDKAIGLLTPIIPRQNNYYWTEWEVGFARIEQGIALTQLGRLEDAVSAFENAQHVFHSAGMQTGLDMAAQSQVRVGEILYALGRSEEADEQFTVALRHFKATQRKLPGEWHTVAPLVVFLCHCPNESLRDANQAVRLAEKFVDDCESSSTFWRYFGLARFRAGDWAGAEKAIRRCMQLRGGGDAVDWLLLAACQFQSERNVQWRDSYNQAQALIASGAPIYYGHIGPLGVARLQEEIETLVGETVKEEASSEGSESASLSNERTGR